MRSATIGATLEKKKKRVRTGRQTLALTKDNPIDLAKRIKAGLPFAHVRWFQNNSQLSLEAINQVLQIPARTLARRKKKGKLTAAESERLLRLTLLFDKALALFEGDKAAAGSWLRTPKIALGKQSPLQAAGTEIGAREVEDLIGRLEYGVYS